MEMLYEGKYLDLVKEGRWEYCRRKNDTEAVMIFACTPENKVLLVEEFRPPIGKRCLCFPAGLSGDEGPESHELAARRELVEAEMVKDVSVTGAEIEADFAARVQAAQASYEASPLDYIYTYERNVLYAGQPSYYVPEGYRGVLQILLPVDETLLKTYQTLAAQLEEQVEKVVEAAENGETVEKAEQNVTQEQLEAARDAILASVQPTCDEIAAKLAGGADILELIDQYNTDPGMQDAANRAEGYSVHMDSVAYDPAFIAAAFSVDRIGELSQPTVGSFGVYLVYYLRDVPAGPAELTPQLRSQLMETLLADKENQVMTDTMERWIGDAQIETTALGDRYASGN